jgi:DNA-binding transcriptional MerR regulator
MLQAIISQREEKNMETDIFSDIHTMKIPGRRSVTSGYAQIIYLHFDEILRLHSVVGFSLATICEYLEEKGKLPVNADAHAFRRAFSREVSRRKHKKGKREVMSVPAAQSQLPKNEEKTGQAQEEKPTRLNFQHLPDDLKEGPKKKRFTYTDYPPHIKAEFDKAREDGTFLKRMNELKESAREWVKQQGGDIE